MNVKFRMPKLGKVTTKSWARELLMTILGTSISIILTFGTAAWLDRRQQEKNRHQTAMMVISNIEVFAQNMRMIDSSLVAWDSTLTRISSLPRDSILRLNDDEAYAFLAVFGQAVLLPRDKTAENIFSNDISTWRDVDNMLFVTSVGECYTFINDIEKNYRIQLDRKSEIYKQFIEDNDYENMTYAECVAAILNMKGAKYFMIDFTQGFVPYFERSIKDLQNMNDQNMEIIGVTLEDVNDFIIAANRQSD